MVGTIKRCTGCHDVVSAIRQQRRQLKELARATLDFGHVHLLRSALNWSAHKRCTRMPRCVSAIRQAKATKRTYSIHVVDLKRPAEIRIELAGIIKRCTGCHDVVSAIRQQRGNSKRTYYIPSLTLNTSHLLRSALNA